MSAATKRLVVVAEHAQGRLAPVTWELLACARQVAPALELEITAVVLGQEPQPLAQEIARRSGVKTWAVEVEGLAHFHGEAQRLALAGLLPRLEAQVVLGAHSTSGLDWAPALATDLGAAYIPGVESVSRGADGPAFWRSAHFGKAREKLTPETWPLVLTVQPGAFEAAPPGEVGQGKVEAIRLSAPPCRTKVLELVEGAGADAGLGRAQVVVAAGRGVGEKENLELLRRVAGLFSSAALAGSRPVCDLGWLGYGQQVGLTGATVAPRLYLACGISGALQHTVGMQGSGFVVAINSDPQAAIFNLADVCVVEDLTAFLSALLEMAGG
ncbi:MAG: electron transfer flavoprotein subunit alpha/FixB family protein [Desulfarculus sp.]|nr:electron transfer flavoprotein subunit alpha/FixB family protein [Pseudomonadota bacterium]MBV1716426.1 electron transfer flavoprotein subunit alpha/FixB family protein [Desulfarculus sp.]MBU4573660.1 electron transfer flavoprotein subunit alpha/FixB family protein [Pseudomonadota bacterium]MBU4598575.1 electron transfer flavoprotein subunit alpha/FixB family protein [Pseudomonadota bacterium]MBV1736910.1 electron transfer flavoprotein subunit alpha/FixB family protein [Desulfarculus sp.]